MAVFIGIDPGVNTGYAVWDTEQKMFRVVATGDILDAMFVAKLARSQWGTEDTPTKVVIEDARKRKWLPQEKSISEYRGRLMGAGSVKRDCEIWESFCKRNGFDLILVPPQKGLTKWTAATFNRVTGWKGRTSNHARDAAMLVFGK